MSYERRTEPNSQYQVTLNDLARRLADVTPPTGGRCLFFLGAGASLGTGLPTAGELSSDMATKCDLEWHQYIPLSTISFYYESRFGRGELNRELVERIDSKKINTPPSLETLMKVFRVSEQTNPSSKAEPIFVITTNYDQHFERAYLAEFKTDQEIIIHKGARDPNIVQRDEEDKNLNWTPYRPVKSPGLWRPSKPCILFKMHGCISQPGNQGLVITEEDYINFLHNSLNKNDAQKTPLKYVIDELCLRTVVFIGYSLSDWNFRAIFKATVEQDPDQDALSYAVQFRDPRREMTDFERARERFWEEKKVKIIYADAHLFLEDLLVAVNSVIAQGKARAEAHNV
jgi:hypothetical protein